MSPKGFLDYHYCIKIVLYGDELYAFKHHGIYPALVWCEAPPADTLLIELDNLSKISSQNVLQPTHIVTDDLSKGRFRGFLQPFFPAGSIKDVLSSLHKNTPSSGWGHLWNKFGSSRSTQKQCLISWPVKHKWCIQMTSALFDLHEQRQYIGYLTPGNFLIDKDGNVKLIDVSPITKYHLPYGPPEKFKCEFRPGNQLKRLLNAERDIFSLGLIFWALAEEKVEPKRKHSCVIPTLLWAERIGCAPSWFHKLVEDCIKRTPSERPSTTLILATLTMHLV